MHMVRELVLGLSWDPKVVAAMEPHEVKFWFESAVQRLEAERQRNQQ